MKIDLLILVWLLVKSNDWLGFKDLLRIVCWISSANWLLIIDFDGYYMSNIFSLYCNLLILCAFRISKIQQQWHDGFCVFVIKKKKKKKIRDIICIIGILVGILWFMMLKILKRIEDWRPYNNFMSIMFTCLCVVYNWYYQLKYHEFWTELHFLDPVCFQWNLLSLVIRFEVYTAIALYNHVIRI